MPEYVERPTTIIAVQYDGSNAQAVNDVVNSVGKGGPDDAYPYDVSESGGTLTLTAHYGNTSSTANPSDWVLSTGLVLDDATFTAQYVEQVGRES